MTSEIKMSKRVRLTGQLKATVYYHAEALTWDLIVAAAFTMFSSDGMTSFQSLVLRPQSGLTQMCSLLEFKILLSM